jgi:hypothetical protein
MDYLKGAWSRDVVKQAMGISDGQLDAVPEYITRHKEAVENKYPVMVRRSEARRAYYEKLFDARVPFPPDMPLEERVLRLRQRLAQQHHTSQ